MRIFMKFLSKLGLLASLISLVSACGMHLSNKEPSAYIKHIGASTVALVMQVDTEDGDTVYHSYCTGVWVGPQTILTAHHCVQGAAEFITQKKEGLEEGTPLDVMGTPIHFTLENEVMGVGEEPSAMHLGKVVFDDEDHDLALVKAVGKAIPMHDVATLADQSPAIGDKIHIVGHQKGLYWTYMEGTVAAYRDELGGSDVMGPWMQLEAPVWFGNSGGGAFNSDGELIGIASRIAKAPSVAYYVHVDSIRKLLEKQKTL
jgi:hypothetical protein